MSQPRCAGDCVENEAAAAVDVIIFAVHKRSSSQTCGEVVSRFWLSVWPRYAWVPGKWSTYVDENPARLAPITAKSTLH